MSGPAHSWTATMPNAAAASRAASRASLALLGRQLLAGGRPHEVMRVAGQRPLRVESVGVGQAGREPAQRGRRRRRVHVDAGQVGGPVADDAVEVVGAGRGAFRPARFVPAVRPDRAVGMRSRVFVDEREAVPQRGGVSQVEPDQRQAGCGEMDMTVDEGGRDEAAVEVDDLRVGKLLAPNVIAAEPRDDAAAHRHRGGVGHGGAVHPPVEKEGRHLFGLALHGYGSTTGPAGSARRL